MPIQLIDDALLLAVLAGVAPVYDDALAAGEIFTTGAWYYRLTRAIHDPRVAGALSSAVAALPVPRQSKVFAGTEELPPQIGLISLRRSVPLMGRLDVGRRLNLLTAEAVAVGLLLEASIVVTTRSSLLENACAVLDIDLVVTEP